MIYLLLLAGVFMGWSLGTNDGANAFGTAVATGVIKYRKAVTIIAVFVILGAFVSGSGNLTKISELATSNKVLATDEYIQTAITNGTQSKLVFQSALKAAIIYACTGITVYVMSYLKITVSSNQAITGAIIGWGLYYADYSDPAVLAVNLPQIGKFAITWIINPVGAMIISFIIVFLANKFLIPKISKLSGYDRMIKAGYLIAGALASYSIGMNSSSIVTALYYDGVADGVKTNLLTNPRLAATIGGIAIAIGVLTYSKKVMMSVGSSISRLSSIEGFLVIIAMSITIFIMGTLIKIPVSTSQALVGAIVGAGLVKNVKNVNFGILKKIGIAWVTSPVITGLLTFIVAWATRGFFA